MNTDSTLNQVFITGYMLLVE